MIGLSTRDARRARRARVGRLAPGLVPALALSGAQIWGPAALAAGPSPLFVASAAARAARSYQVTTVVTDTSGTSGTAAGSMITNRAVIVRRGALLQLWLTVTYATRSRTRVFETVDTGRHSCGRTNGATRWTCGPTRNLGVLYSTVDVRPGAVGSVNGSTLRLGYTPAGDRIVGGVPCMGYAVTITGSGFSSRGTFWAARTTHLPVRYAGSASVVVSRGAPPRTSATTVTWGRWNDPGLRMPPVPAS